MSPFSQNSGLGVHLNILSTNPFQAAPRFQGIDKIKRIAQFEFPNNPIQEGDQLKLIIRLTLTDSHFVQGWCRPVNCTMVFLLPCRFKEGAPQERVTVKNL